MQYRPRVVIRKINSNWGNAIIPMWKIRELCGHLAQALIFQGENDGLKRDIGDLSRENFSLKGQSQHIEQIEGAEDGNVSAEENQRPVRNQSKDWIS